MKKQSEYSSTTDNPYSFFSAQRRVVTPALAEKQPRHLTLEELLPVDFSVAAKQVRECAAELSAVNVGPDSELIARKSEQAAIAFEKLYRGNALRTEEKPFHLLYNVLLVMSNHPDAFPKEKFGAVELIIEDLANLAFNKQESATRISRVQPSAWIQYAGQEKPVPYYLPKDNESTSIYNNSF